MDSVANSNDDEGNSTPEPMFVLKGFFNTDKKQSKGLKYSIKVTNHLKEHMRNTFLDYKKASFKEYNVLQLVKINECK